MIRWRECARCDVLWKGPQPCWSCNAPGAVTQRPALTSRVDFGFTADDYYNL